VVLISPLALFLAFLVSCETAQQAAARLPKTTPVLIVFDTTDTLYVGGLGEAGLDGFCKRIRSYLVKDLAKRGITAAPSSAESTGDARITISLSTVEIKTGLAVGLTGVGLVPYASGKPHVKYSAMLQSPSGNTVTTWHHELDEHSIDRVCEHIAGDVAGYLSQGFR
jgi:hypothetical protein